MAAGQGQMTQKELNREFCKACSRENDLARAEELLGRGADQHILRMVSGTLYTGPLTWDESRL